MLNNILTFIIVVGIPGVISFFVNSAIGWSFGIMGGIWLFAMIFLGLNSIKEKKWNHDHWEEHVTGYMTSKIFDVIAILVIIGIPVLAFGFGIIF